MFTYLLLSILNILEKGERRGCSNGAWPYKENCHTEKQFKENGDPYTFTECKCKSDLCNGSSTISTGFGFFFFYTIIYYLMHHISNQLFWLFLRNKNCVFSRQADD